MGDDRDQQRDLLREQRRAGGGMYTYFRAVTITNSIITNSTGGDCADGRRQFQRQPQPDR